MTATLSKIAVCLLPLLLFSTSWAQPQRRDPLTPGEVDELRDAAQDPETRLKLFVKFARARLDSLQQMRADPKVTDRAQQTHDLLQDFLDVYDELNDNLDTFVERKVDLRKPLRGLIEADNEFQAKLRALKDAADVSKRETEKYQFLMDNALETVDSSSQDHRQLLVEEEEAAKRKKK